MPRRIGPKGNKWDLVEAEKQTSKILRFGLEKFARIVQKEIDKNAVGSIKGKTRVFFGLRKIEIVNDHEAAAFKEFGTPPHEITPVTAKALRWFKKGFLGFGKSKAIFAKRVFHPGTAPDPFFRKGITRAIKQVKRAFG